MIGDVGRSCDLMPLEPPSRAELDALFRAKHGDPEAAG